jgi:hypothetical protein
MDGFSEMTPALHFRRVVVAAGAFNSNSHDAGHRDIGRCVDGPAPLAGRTGQRGLVIVGYVYFLHGVHLLIVIVYSINQAHKSEKGMAHAMPKNRSESIPCKPLQQDTGYILLSTARKDT